MGTDRDWKTCYRCGVSLRHAPDPTTDGHHNYCSHRCAAERTEHNGYISTHLYIPKVRTQ